MPALSVVVPIYNVEDYLEACLDSIAAQTFRDLEVVLVVDGATDRSGEIAEAYAARDPRFKVVRRPNGGLSAARNTGIEHATGELLAFVDSDDLLTENAYELLVGSLRETCSDFATGKVLRLTGTRTKSARFLIPTFREPRQRTHVKRFQPLLADRTAWNKVFRRSFWDAQGLRFPEGRINEDIPVMLPLHFGAKAVDVIAEPVYLWRMRDTGELSITERRAEIHALEMRLLAVTDVITYLEQHESRKVQRWYEETLVAQDLIYHLNVLDRASDAYREMFFDRVNALLDRADDRIYDPLPAIARLKWWLVRRRLLPELLEVLQFERAELADTPPLRIGRRWYGDYPFRGDPRLGIPDDVYRLGPELTFTARIERLEREGDRLHVHGLAFVDGIGASAQGSQRVSVSAVAPGPLRRVRLMTTALRLKTREVHRPDANADGGDRLSDVEWSGFEATLDVGRLKRAGRWREGAWDLFVTARAPGVTRRRVRFFFGELEHPQATELPSPPDVLVRAVPTPDREVRLEVRTTWAALRTARVTHEVLELAGDLHGVTGDALKLELRDDAGGIRLRRPLALDGERFTATVPVERLLRAAREAADRHADDAEEPGDGSEAEGDEDAAGAAGAVDRADDEDPLAAEADEGPIWELSVVGGGRRLRLVLRADADEPTWPCGERELTLLRTAQGEAALALRGAHGVLTDARWSDDGALVLHGTAPATGERHEVVLMSRATSVVHAFPAVAPVAAGANFEVEVDPGRIESLAGLHPLREGSWQVSTRPQGAVDPEAVRALHAAGLRERLPRQAEAAGKAMALAVTADDRLIVVARRDLREDERGPFNQRRLRERVFLPACSEPLTDTVVYSSFQGRQCSDSPRAIHAELLRRDAPLEHLWIVSDGQADVPPGARVLRDGSREMHEAMARSRYLVFNDHFPEWFQRRDDQVCLQTWHGTPLKQVGFDVPDTRAAPGRPPASWPELERTWQHVVSPSAFATPILRRAFALTGEILETGYPRVDVLAAPDREARAARVRERLGIPDGVRAVLYAPTFRDSVRDGRRRFLLDPRLDVERLRDVLGPGSVLLFRKHHEVVDAVPETADGFVRDVSAYPDATELLLAADVLITDYSSMMVDYANTGRPILLYAYDLDTYRDITRGFSVDYEETMPGPVLRTGDELAAALADVDAVQAAYAERYDAFVGRFCEHDDGGASARVVDRVFADVVAPVRG